MEFLENEGFNFQQDPWPIQKKTIDILGTAIYARRDEVQKIMVERTIQSANDKYLIDYNYNVEMIMSSSSSQNAAIPLLVLELQLLVNQDDTTGVELNGKGI